MRFRGNVLSSSGLLEQNGDPTPIVHPLPGPTRGGGAPIDAETLALVNHHQALPISQWPCVLRCNALEGLAVRSENAYRSIVEALDHHSALVYLTVMHKVG